MPFIPCNNVVEASIRFLLDEQLVENVFHFHKTAVGAITALDLADLAGQLLGWWETVFSYCLPIELIFNEIYLRDLTTAEGLEETASTTTRDAGRVSGGVLPNQDTFCVSFRTGFTGRSNRGRVYLPALLKAYVTQNTVADGAADDIVARYGGLASAADAAGFTHVVTSKYSGMGGVPRRPIPRAAGVSKVITSYLAADRTVDSMDRRKPGRGR